MRWAHRKHYLDRNPMERMQSPHPYVARERVLIDMELARLWKTAGDNTFGKIVKLLILTGQRRGEIAQLKGSMIGLDTITLPATLCKNRRAHIFPARELARTFLDPEVEPEEYFFKARGKETPFDGWSKCKPKLEERARVDGWTLHDLRRTFASGLAAQGVSIPVIERLLNHMHSVSRLRDFTRTLSRFFLSLALFRFSFFCFLLQDIAVIVIPLRSRQWVIGIAFYKALSPSRDGI